MIWFRWVSSSICVRDRDFRLPGKRLPHEPEDLDNVFVAYCGANSSSYESWAHKLAICGVHLDMGLDSNQT